MEQVGSFLSVGEMGMQAWRRFCCSLDRWLAQWLAALALGITVQVSATADVLKETPVNALSSQALGPLVAELAARRGEVVVINFWASWCEPCREEMPALQQLAKRWKGRGVSVLTVAVGDSPRQVEDFLWEISAELPVVHDRDQSIARVWGARVLPTTFVIDTRRRVRLKALGAVDWTNRSVDAQLERLVPPRVP